MGKAAATFWSTSALGLLCGQVDGQLAHHALQGVGAGDACERGVVGRGDGGVHGGCRRIGLQLTLGRGQVGGKRIGRQILRRRDGVDLAPEVHEARGVVARPRWLRCL